MSGTIENIYIRRDKTSPVTPVREAVADETGLVDDHSKPGRRALTVISAEAWRRACADLGKEVDPGTRRANLLVSGLELEASAGKKLRVGEVLVELLGETEPCGLMDQLCPGLREALVPEWRGGVFGRVLEGGKLRVGDAAAFVDDA